MVDCLLECLQEAHLEKYHVNFIQQGLTQCEALTRLQMHDYARFGIVSMADRVRLFKLIQIIKSVQSEGLYCKHEQAEKHGAESSGSAAASKLSNIVHSMKSSSSADPSHAPPRKVLGRPPVDPQQRRNEQRLPSKIPQEKKSPAKVDFRPITDSPIFNCRKTLTFDESELDETKDEIIEPISTAPARSYNSDNELVNGDTKCVESNGGGFMMQSREQFLRQGTKQGYNPNMGGNSAQSYHTIQAGTSVTHLVSQDDLRVTVERQGGTLLQDQVATAHHSKPNPQAASTWSNIFGDYQKDMRSIKEGNWSSERGSSSVVRDGDRLDFHHTGNESLHKKPALSHHSAVGSDGSPAHQIKVPSPKKYQIEEKPKAEHTSEYAENLDSDSEMAVLMDKLKHLQDLQAKRAKLEESQTSLSQMTATKSRSVESQLNSAGMEFAGSLSAHASLTSFHSHSAQLFSPLSTSQHSSHSSIHASTHNSDPHSLASSAHLSTELFRKDDLSGLRSTDTKPNNIEMSSTHSFPPSTVWQPPRPISPMTNLSERSLSNHHATSNPSWKSEYDQMGCDMPAAAENAPFSQVPALRTQSQLPSMATSTDPQTSADSYISPYFSGRRDGHGGNSSSMNTFSAGAAPNNHLQHISDAPSASRNAIPSVDAFARSAAFFIETRSNTDISPNVGSVKSASSAFNKDTMQSSAYFPSTMLKASQQKEVPIERIVHGMGYNYGVPSSPQQASQSHQEKLGVRGGDHKIRVCVRKRPLTKREMKRQDADVVKKESSNTVVVTESRVAIDLSKYIQQHEFTFDEVFDSECTNQRLYSSTAKPLVKHMLSGGCATCFAFGQTGAGKTYTLMGTVDTPGLYVLAGSDLCAAVSADKPKRGIRLWLSYYEIYCGQLYDLLNKRKKLFVRENGKHRVCIAGLMETQITNPKEMIQAVEYGNACRRIGTTGVNPNSSRSHAILQMELRDNHEKRLGRLTFIDLAGSERASDATDYDRKTRIEGAEINQSLLALKECIRSLDQDNKHTPFRQSKLTHILRESFTGNARTCMIANISPTLSASENTLNTLRYASRVKELRHVRGASGAPSSSHSVAPTNSAAVAPTQSHSGTTSTSSPTGTDSDPIAPVSSQPPVDGAPTEASEMDVTGLKTGRNLLPSLFHPSAIQCSSTPKNGRTKSLRDPECSFSQLLDDESPVRGHKIRKNRQITASRSIETQNNVEENSGENHPLGSAHVGLPYKRDVLSEFGHLHQRSNSEGQLYGKSSTKMDQISPRDITGVLSQIQNRETWTSPSVTSPLREGKDAGSQSKHFGINTSSRSNRSGSLHSSTGIPGSHSLRNLSQEKNDILSEHQQLLSHLDSIIDKARAVINKPSPSIHNSANLDSSNNTSKDRLPSTPRHTSSQPSPRDLAKRNISGASDGVRSNSSSSEPMSIVPNVYIASGSQNSHGADNASQVSEHSMSNRQTSIFPPSPSDVSSASNPNQHGRVCEQSLMSSQGALDVKPDVAQTSLGVGQSHLPVDNDIYTFSTGSPCTTISVVPANYSSPMQVQSRLGHSLPADDLRCMTTDTHLRQLISAGDLPAMSKDNWLDPSMNQYLPRAIFHDPIDQSETTGVLDKVKPKTVQNLKTNDVNGVSNNSCGIDSKTDSETRASYHHHLHKPDQVSDGSESSVSKEMNSNASIDVCKGLSTGDEQKVPVDSQRQNAINSRQFDDFLGLPSNTRRMSPFQPYSPKTHGVVKVSSEHRQQAQESGDIYKPPITTESYQNSRESVTELSSDSGVVTRGLTAESWKLSSGDDNDEGHGSTLEDVSSLGAGDASLRRSWDQGGRSSEPALGGRKLGEAMLVRQSSDILPSTTKRSIITKEIIDKDGKVRQFGDDSNGSQYTPSSQTGATKILTDSTCKQQSDLLSPRNNALLKTEKLAPVTFAPIHPCPITNFDNHVVRTPSVITKSFVNDVRWPISTSHAPADVSTPSSQGSNSTNRTELELLKIQSVINDIKPQLDPSTESYDDSSAAASKQNQPEYRSDERDAISVEQIEESAMKSPGVQLTDTPRSSSSASSTCSSIERRTAQQKAQSLLVMAHEDQLAEITNICKAEMKLLMQLKLGHMSFDEYVEGLKEVLASKSECVETLRSQIHEFSNYPLHARRSARSDHQ